MLLALTRTAFFTSLVSYVGFWLADLVEPGFVSRYFSVHVFLLSSIVFGLLWSHLLEEYEERPLVQLVVSVALGLLAAVFVWQVAGEYRMLLSLGAFTTVVLSWKVVAIMER